jgi:hypothetical protein
MFKNYLVYLMNNVHNEETDMANTISIPALSFDSLSLFQGLQSFWTEILIAFTQFGAALI